MAVTSKLWLKRKTLKLIVLGITMMTSACLPYDHIGPEPEDGIRIVDPAISPDGNKVAFSVSWKNSHYRVVVMDREKQTIAPLGKLPIDRSWHTGSFSPDGKSLIVTTICYVEKDGCPPEESGSQIALIDLASQTHKTLTSGTDDHASPTYSFDGRSIIMTVNQDRSHSIVRQYLDDGRQEVIAGPDDELVDRFSLLSQINEISSDTFVFSVFTAWKKGVSNDKSWANSRDKSFRYSKKQGLQELSFTEKMYSSQLTADENGKTLVFVSMSANNPTNENGHYNYDFFTVLGGEVVPLTNLESFVHDPQLSRDGKHLVFLEDNSRKRMWDIWYMNVPDGTPQSLGVRKALNKIFSEM